MNLLYMSYQLCVKFFGWVLSLLTLVRLAVTSKNWAYHFAFWVKISVDNILKYFSYYTLPNDSGRVLWYHIVCPSVHPPSHLSVSGMSHLPVFSFLDDNLSR